MFFALRCVDGVCPGCPRRRHPPQHRWPAHDRLRHLAVLLRRVRTLGSSSGCNLASGRVPTNSTAPPRPHRGDGGKAPWDPPGRAHMHLALGPLASPTQRSSTWTSRLLRLQPRPRLCSFHQEQVRRLPPAWWRSVSRPRRRLMAPAEVASSPKTRGSLIPCLEDGKQRQRSGKRRRRDLRRRRPPGRQAAAVAGTLTAVAPPL